MTLLGRPRSLSRFILAARSDIPEQAELSRAFGNLLPPQGLHPPFEGAASSSASAAPAAVVKATSMGVVKFGATGLLAGTIVSSLVATVSVPAPRDRSALPATTISENPARPPGGASREFAPVAPLQPALLPSRSPMTADPATDPGAPMALGLPKPRTGAALEPSVGPPGPVAVLPPSPGFPGAAANVDAESRLIEAAREALHRDPARALALATEHLRSFPSGLLVIEREVLAIHALRALGQETQALERLTRLAAAYPDSIHVTRLRQALGQLGRPAGVTNPASGDTHHP